jgi:hypothetical protein
MLEFHGHFGCWTLTSSAIVNRPGAISCLVTENMSGAIPTQLGHLVQLTDLNLSENQLLTGKAFLLRLIDWYTGVYQKLKKTFLPHRQHSDGARAVHGHDDPPAGPQPIDR